MSKQKIALRNVRRKSVAKERRERRADKELRHLMREAALGRIAIVNSLLPTFQWPHDA